MRGFCFGPICAALAVYALGGQVVMAQDRCAQFNLSLPAECRVSKCCRPLDWADGWRQRHH